ncbi:hypothetical protein OH492_07975 [Vibrio chagasii]|nr:hypothetical protein [Vibrio chagasii]
MADLSETAIILPKDAHQEKRTNFSQYYEVFRQRLWLPGSSGYANR